MRRKVSRQNYRTDLRNVTDAAASLSDSDQNFRFLAEALPLIIWTAAADGTVDYMNSRWFEYTGLTAEETYSGTGTAVHPEELELYHKRWADAVRKRQPYEMEYRFRRKSDGMYRWHLGRGLPVKDEKGRVLKWFGTCTDIHDHKLAEAEVRKLNEQLEQKVQSRTRALEREIQERREIEKKDRANLELLKIIINTLPMAAAAADRDYAVLHANEAFSAIVTPEQDVENLIGRSCITLLRKAKAKFSDSSQFEAMIAQLESGKAAPFHRELLTREGRTFSFDYVPIATDNFPHAHLLLYRDISQEKRINNAKTEFMSLASHQLRTPLTAVRWALSRLSKRLAGTADGVEQQLLMRAKNEIGNMSATITTMLAISRVEAGMLSLNRAPCHMAVFLETIRFKFLEACVAKKLTLTLRCPADLIIETDQQMLREIVENIVTNAIKYTPPGGGISIRAVRKNGSMELSVSDTGYGIPKDQQHRIFTKFFRAENAISVDTEGTGLGLYLVSQLVGLLRGSISFTSQLQKGTTFVVQLPL